MIDGRGILLSVGDLAAVVVVCAAVLPARPSKSALESRHAGPGPVASARLKKLINQVLKIAEAAVSDGQDVPPVAITEGGERPGIHNFDAKVLGLDEVEDLNYRNSVEMGRKFLSTRDSDAAVFAYSAHVRIGQLDTGRNTRRSVRKGRSGDVSLSSNRI